MIVRDSNIIANEAKTAKNSSGRIVITSSLTISTKLIIDTTLDRSSEVSPKLTISRLFNHFQSFIKCQKPMNAFCNYAILEFWR